MDSVSQVWLPLQGFPFSVATTTFSFGQLQSLLVDCLTASFVAFCLLLFCAITSSPFVDRLKQAINAGNKSGSKFIKEKNVHLIIN